MEGILLNVKNTDGGSSTATLVIQALKSKKIFVFGELLALPQVQKLKSSKEYVAIYNALEIFAYGVYSDYTKTPGLPELNEIQLLKLRQLTIVSLASRSKSLDYSVVIRETGVNNVREVEDLVISCVYDGLLRARLDQRNQKFLIQWCAARDVRPETIDEMILKLGSWCDAANGILQRIDLSIENAGKKRKQEMEEHKWVYDEAEHVKGLVMKESSESTLGKADDSTSTRTASTKRGVLSMVPGFLGRRN